MRTSEAKTSYVPQARRVNVPQARTSYKMRTSKARISYVPT